MANMTMGVLEAASGVEPVRRTRGKSKQPNWTRPDEVAVIRLDVDVSADPAMRRRLESQFQAVYQLERALKRMAASRCRAYWAASRERETKGTKAVRERLGLSRAGFEKAAYEMVERSGWLRHHVTKAVACHTADYVWEAARRNLFNDATGKRMGVPKPCRWWDFTRIVGRARSHTKARVWESWRLAGTLQGHLDVYGASLSIQQASQLPAGASAFTQPGSLPARPKPDAGWGGQGGWWSYVGPLQVVFTGLPAGDLILPVRLAQGAGAFPRLAHFLADQDAWHKIDLVRVQDRKAPGGWRYQAHLTILGAGWNAESTIERRNQADSSRLAGVDANVSNVAVVSMPASTLKSLDSQPGSL
ncbi:MAG: hypothetical protein LBR21_10740, partial [Propionibacteriaceae bacterium]|nr:hypothetical protein [Propionibacteriaceae bacterium]